jgi:hypothetical protein
MESCLDPVSVQALDPVLVQEKDQGLVLVKAPVTD